MRFHQILCCYSFKQAINSQCVYLGLLVVAKQASTIISDYDYACKSGKQVPHNRSYVDVIQKDHCDHFTNDSDLSPLWSKSDQFRLLIRCCSNMVSLLTELLLIHTTSKVANLQIHSNAFIISLKYSHANVSTPTCFLCKNIKIVKII